ncbi:GNAT family N-acetyltransferase [Candidatus Woesearchaeota archaeon]|nr:GNAT family N-acetyltransferase [Candidatus Woesearchaeota archaeon]
MKIDKPNTEELKQLVKIYKEVFEIHNIFQKPEDEVVSYLETVGVEGELLVAVEDDRVAGGLLVTYEEQIPGHTRARVKHLAVTKDFQSKGVGSELLKKADEIVGKGKIEIHVSENEKNALDFYKRNGYEVEGQLKSHYRPGEKCYILGKVLE